MALDPVFALMSDVDASEPKRIQLRRTKGWRKPEGAVVVSRPSKWGNPFRISRSGGTVYGPNWTQARDNWGQQRNLAEYALYISGGGEGWNGVAESVRIFRGLITVRMRDEPDRFTGWIARLRGRDLACWCPLDQPCHADVLLEVANS
jgi:hypothetical protein